MRLLMIFLALAACDGAGTTVAPPVATSEKPFHATPVGTFDEPWAMALLPGGDMLITEKPGRLLLVSADGRTKTPVTGVPKVAYGGQGGLADVVLHPDYANTGYVYLSYAEPGPARRWREPG